MENSLFARRNMSIDMLRGLTMLLMVFVNDLWTVGGVPHFLEHFETSSVALDSGYSLQASFDAVSLGTPSSCKLFVKTSCRS